MDQAGAIRRAAKPEFKRRRRKRTQEIPNEPNLALNIQISKNIWFPKRTRFQAKEVANGGPRRRDFGWRRGICKDNAVTGARVRQPGFIVTDDHQISGARDFGMHAKPDERKGIQILGRSVMGAAGLVGSRGGASALPIRSFEPGLKRGELGTGFGLHTFWRVIRSASVKG